jgi:23S rRNA pseudouridine955/2504/2580 synthase
MPKSLTLTAAADDDGRRLDRILRKTLPDMPLSGLHRLLRKGRVLVDGLPGKAADRVRAGSVIQTPFEGTVAPGPADSGGGPKRSPAPILWEGTGLLILNKPAGLAAHGPDSLETQVRAYLAPKLPPSLSFKPGPLHRLDKPTSGIIVFSTSLEGARNFSALLRERRIRKTYLALLDGFLDRDETWEDALVRDRELGKSFAAPSGHTGDVQKGEAFLLSNSAALNCPAKEARTRVYPLAQSAISGPDQRSAATLVRLEIDTGRTHQIRAQAAARGHPLAGDRKYGGGAGGFLLHAWMLELPGQVESVLPGLPRRILAPLPDNFRRRIRELFGEIDISTAPQALQP